MLSKCLGRSCEMEIMYISFMVISHTCDKELHPLSIALPDNCQNV